MLSDSIGQGTGGDFVHAGALPDFGPVSAGHLSDNIPAESGFVEITVLSYIPGRAILRYMGLLSFHFVKESYLDYDDLDLTKGMAGFAHGFFGDTLAVVRAHAASLGGNAVVGFRIDQAVFNENVKGTGYAVITCSGDVVQLAPAQGDEAHPLTWSMDLQMKLDG